MINRSVTDALAYVEYVTNTIRNKELFHSIDMKFAHSWDVLLWCDPANFGGVRSKLPSGGGGEGEGAGTPLKNKKGRGDEGDESDNDEENIIEEDEDDDERR